MKIIPSLLGSVFVFLLATSCCWLPWLVVLLGGSALGASAFSTKLELFSGPLMVLGVGLMTYAGYSFWQKKIRAERVPRIVLKSCTTCPKCGFSKNETMPTNACQFFYECENCKTLLKPLAGDCCVFCSYGTVKCPPMQTGSKTCC
jgi:hypothetical protein